MMEEIVSILWRAINYVEYWAEQIFSACGVDLRYFVACLVFMYAGYHFLLAPYIKGTGFGFLDYTTNKTYKGGKNR